MTPTPALLHLVVAATSSKSNPLITLLPLVAIGVLGYFFFIRPQQRKAQAATAGPGLGIRGGGRGADRRRRHRHRPRDPRRPLHAPDRGAGGRRQPRRPAADQDRLRAPGHRPEDRADRGRARRRRTGRGRGARRAARTATTATSTTSVATVPPARVTVFPARVITARRLKRREPQVGGPGPTTPATQPADQRPGCRCDLGGVLRRRVRREVVARDSGWTSPAASRSSTRPRVTTSARPISTRRSTS